MPGKRYTKTQYPDIDLLPGIGTFVFVNNDGASSGTGIGQSPKKGAIEEQNKQIIELQIRLKEVEKGRITKWDIAKIILEILVAITTIGAFIIGEMALLATILFFLLK